MGEEDEFSRPPEAMKEFLTGLSGKMILFDGEYREREIDIYFAINPKIEQLTYSRLVP